MILFVSYRRDDSIYETGRLCDRLMEEFGRDKVFKDVDSIPVGRDFRAVIRDEVARCHALLAVIGETWLTAQDAQGRRRLDDPADHLRIEVETALKRGIPVVPLLFGKAQMPKAEELPESLRELAFRHGMQIQPDPHFHQDVDRLVEAIRALPVAQAEARDNQSADAGSETDAAPIEPVAAPERATAQYVGMPRGVLTGGIAALALILAALVAWIFFKRGNRPVVADGPRVVTLNVALASQGGLVVEDYLRAYESDAHSIYEKQNIDFHIHIVRKGTDDYESARNEFKHDGFDIVMMDDPWVPEYAPLMEDLQSLGVTKQSGGAGTLERLFPQSLLTVCKFTPPGSDHPILLGLPLTGNVQLILARNDLLAKAMPFLPADLPTAQVVLTDPINAVMRHGDLLQQKLSVSEPIALRYDTPNSVTEIFWELLRAQDYNEQINAAGEVMVPLRMADAAMEWIRSAQHGPPNRGRNADQLTARLVSGDSVMVFGWPNWIVPFVNSDQADHIDVIQASRHPVLGAWLLGIPKSSRQKDFALELLLRLTTKPIVQERLARDGIVPALRSINASDVGKSGFWARNFEKIQEAQQDARARPRMTNWSAVEDTVGQQVLEGLQNRSKSPFQSNPGIVRFTAD